MTTETTTTEQEQGQWVYVTRDGDFAWSNDGDQLVLITYHDGEVAKDIERAMRDPANVLNVSALPKVVEALENTMVFMRRMQTHFAQYADSYGYTTEDSDLMESNATALSLVHPSAEGDKT